MRQFQNGNSYILVLERGEELLSSLTAFALQNNLTTLWLQSGLGGASDATLGSYNLEAQHYIWSRFDGAYEIANLQGNMTTIDGEAQWHIHATLGDPQLRAVAGHVKNLTVGLTCELLLVTLETPMTRMRDEVTGLKLLTSKS